MTRRWRIGELAAATGLTVRTLHHYEHLGLLAPGRSDGRQRLYDERDVRRLYRVRALRDVGLSLAELGRVLDGDGASLSRVLEQHRARVTGELTRLKKLKALLDHACARAKRGGAPVELLDMIEAMSRITRRPSGRAARWRKLGADLRALMQSREPPHGPRARAFAKRAQQALVDFAGGDAATLAALSRLRKTAPPTKTFAGWTPKMIRYLDQALQEVK